MRSITDIMAVILRYDLLSVDAEFDTWHRLQNARYVILSHLRDLD